MIWDDAKEILDQLALYGFQDAETRSRQIGEDLTSLDVLAIPNTPYLTTGELVNLVEVAKQHSANIEISVHRHGSSPFMRATYYKATRR